VALYLAGGRPDLKLRVWGSLVLLLLAKVATLAVPSPSMGDRCAGRDAGCALRCSWLTWALAAPIMMTVAYGGTRILMAALTQMRDGLFAKVAMHAVRRWRS